MSCSPKKAFVLAAGEGRRMRPLTDHCPKPLLEVGGMTMLDRALDALVDAGVEEVVVNTYYLGEMIEKHLAGRKTPRIVISREEALLDTGGGVKKVLDFFGDEPFYVLNADIVWVDGQQDTLKRLAHAWDSDKMDLLLLLHPTAALENWPSAGDYYLQSDLGQPVFAKKDAQVAANHVFAGPRIVHPRAFVGGPEDEAFSFLKLFHLAESRGRLFGLSHDGEWHHVGTPAEFEKTNAHFAAKPLRKRAP